jgi:hypothetical protein
MSVDSKSAQQLKSVNCIIDGKLEVTTDMNVMRHNATDTPRIFGLLGSYGWKISSERLTSPSIILAPPKPVAGQPLTLEEQAVRATQAYIDKLWLKHDGHSYIILQSSMESNGMA